ncbi:uncharacterized protein LOC111518475 [Drosophila willistoni]|uniref:uncharacterized protein LOC111518475 n=1 Tax=Drosophila willistoni TaxID=7260 RepID=UPI00017D72F7|nr:uncharacterized protein LOC111518475 [Drosophila willistoni]
MNRWEEDMARMLPADEFGGGSSRSNSMVSRLSRRFKRCCRALAGSSRQLPPLHLDTDYAHSSSMDQLTGSSSRQNQHHHHHHRRSRRRSSSLSGSVTRLKLRLRRSTSSPG